jgi:hypothetical protein
MAPTAIPTATAADKSLLLIQHRSMTAAALLISLGVMWL